MLYIRIVQPNAVTSHNGTHVIIIENGTKVNTKMWANIRRSTVDLVNRAISYNICTGYILKRYFQLTHYVLLDSMRQMTDINRLLYTFKRNNLSTKPDD